MDEDLPIDIHYNKLLDWLLNRRHCNQNWQQMVLGVREKINFAIQDMPAVDEVARLLHGSYINYFHCVEIIRLLKLTEDNSRNIFGRYSSQRLKDWTDIIKLYEKDDIFIAEAAQLLARNVNFEIPTLKKQIAKCVQAQQDYARKEVEYAKASSDLHESYISSCKQMGIEGRRIKRELVQLVKDLPATYDNIAASIQSLKPAVEYYSCFVAFVLSRVEASRDCLPMLRYVIASGNVSVFEWRTGRKPARVEGTLLEGICLSDDDDVAANATEETDEIDWGDAGSGSVPAETDPVPAIVDETEMNVADEIDWSAVDDISSGIELEITGDKDFHPDITVDSTDVADVARCADALTLLDNTPTRNDIVNELLELESFLEQRLTETSTDSSDDVLAAVIIQLAPSSLHVDATQISGMLTCVCTVLSQLTSQRMRDLMLIRSSPRYVDRLAGNLHKLTSDAEEMTSLSRLMSTRRDESTAEQQLLEPQLDVVRQKTRQLQRQVEGEISKRYRNRRVNIMGEINTI